MVLPRFLGRLRYYCISGCGSCSLKCSKFMTHGKLVLNSSPTAAMSQLDVLRGSPNRSPSHTQSRGNQRSSREGDRSSSNDRASPGSWGDRGRSRTRRQSNPFSQDNLRRRYAFHCLRWFWHLHHYSGYHTLHSSFGNAFHVEKRWKMIRDLGSGAYGVVMWSL